MTQVIKRDGRREELDPDKIKRSLQEAMKDAGDIEETKRDIIELVSRNTARVAGEREQITTSELRKIITTDIGKIDRAVLNAWINYELKKHNECQDQ